MKNICLLMVGICVCFSVLSNGKTNSNKLILNDSTLRQRFIMSVLQDYELEDRWVFVQIDSLYKLKNNYEVVNTSLLYKIYASSYTSYNNKMFVFDIFGTLINQTTLERYANKKPLLKGIKVNLSIYKALLKQPKEKILSMYFNSDKTLKKQYKKWLYEIIAVCYTNNVKVITPSNAQPYYQVFK